VAALAVDDIWMVGGSNTVHWGGAGFTLTQGPQGVSLESLAARATDDVWAVGVSDAGPSSTTLRGVILHWNDLAWSEAARLGPGYLNAISPLSASDVWAVGDFIARYAPACGQFLPMLAK
jgi:hypothetical protein